MLPYTKSCLLRGESFSPAWSSVDPWQIITSQQGQSWGELHLYLPISTHSNVPHLQATAFLVSPWVINNNERKSQTSAPQEAPLKTQKDTNQLPGILGCRNSRKRCAACYSPVLIHSEYVLLGIPLYKTQSVDYSSQISCTFISLKILLWLYCN